MTLPTRQETGRAVAIAVAALAPVVMAAAQAMVIRDRVATVHPAWPAWAVAAMAIGFELAILTTGLAIVVTGHKDKRLLYAEGFLIAMSVTVAVTAVVEWAPWVLGLTIALVPVQYACAFYAAHTLYVHWYGQPAPVTATVPTGAAEATPATPPRKAPKPTAAPKPADWHPEAWRLIAEGYNNADVARMVGRDAAAITRLKARAGLNGAGT